MNFSIEGKKIGAHCAPFIIAEMSGNHMGDIDRAKRLIRAAKTAGASAIKLQTYTADTLTIDHDSAPFLIRGGLWDGYKLYDLYQEAHTPWEWHRALFEEAKKNNLTIFSSPFDHSAVDLLESLGTPLYKIASFELVDLPLIRRVAQTGKPMIMSTGNATLADIEEAVITARDHGCKELVLLHCISGYPTPAFESNLLTIKSLSDNFGCLVGLSDHSLEIGVSIAAVALGACVIEKHFTLSRSQGGSDAAFSLEPDEFALLVRNCEIAQQAIGKVSYLRTVSELKTKDHRRSLYVVKNIKKGEKITADNVRSIRPGHGLPPKFYDEVMGKIAHQDLAFGTPLSFDAITSILDE